jgi:nucleoside-diphosphate-sugar epimerase
MCTAYAKQDNIDFVCVRLGKAFGPDFAESDTRIGASFLQKAARGENIIMNTKGQQRASFVFIINAVTSLLSVLTCGKPGEAYNAAQCGEAISAYEFAEMCASTGGVKVEVKESNADMGYSKVTHMIQNFDKIKALGVRSPYTVESGVRASIEVLRKNSGDKK